MVKGQDIEERLVDFAVRIIRVCECLPDKPAERHIRGQLLRSSSDEWIRLELAFGVQNPGLHR